MLTTWLQVLALLTVFLIGSALPAQETVGQDAPTVMQTTGQINADARTEPTLNCGHGKHTGVVQYWRTRFGQLQNHGNHGELGAIFMLSDGSLFRANASRHHSGLYYCLLLDTKRITLWPYQSSTGPKLKGGGEQRRQQHNVKNLLFTYGGRDANMTQVSSTNLLQDSGYGAFVHRAGPSRPRRERGGLGPEEEGRQEAGISDGRFAGAVASSVVVTFLLGFSAGALSRTHVLRCFRVVAGKARSLQRRRPSDTTNRGFEVTMATLPSTYENWVFYHDIESAKDANSVDTTSSPGASPPPRAKEERDRTTHLEGCDPMAEEKEEGRREEGGSSEGEAGVTGEDRRGGGEAMEEEGEMCGGGSSLWQEGEGGGESCQPSSGPERGGGEVEGRGETESRSEGRGEAVEDEPREEQTEAVGAREEESGGDAPRDGGDPPGGDDSDSSSDTDSKDEDDKRQQQDGGEGRPVPARRSRVIRLYQYDEEGRRYSHLAGPIAERLSPAPRAKQRSLSLTRLNAIMAAASASPLASDGAATGERPRSPSSPPPDTAVFKMDI